MKENQKSLISTLLLVVGVIFILVAGGIFVTTAWQYLPEIVKQFVLLVVSLGLFAASHAVSKKEKLGKIAHALYYLGVAFVGFFVIAIMGGMVNGSAQENGLKVMTASLIMLAPVILKVMSGKNGLDFVVMSLLVDGLIFSSCVTFSLGINAYLLMQAVHILVLALIDYKEQTKGNNGKVFAACIGIVYLVHAICQSVLSLGYTFASQDEVITVVVLVSAIIAVTAISWNAGKQTAFRIVNSVALFWLIYVSVRNLCSAMDMKKIGLMWLMILFVNALIMVGMKRKEMIIMQAGTAMLVPFIQLLSYWSDAWSLLDGIDEQWTTTYYPLSFVCAAAFLALYVIENGSENILTDWKESKTLKFAGLQVITGCVVWMASKMSETHGMVFFLLGATSMLSVAVFADNKLLKKIFHMFAMFAWILAVFVQPFVEIPNDYAVEWTCFLVAMGIVLFRFIWYDEKEKLSILYFVTTCILLTILLINNMAVEGLGNLLILGMTGIVMLVVSAITNNKKYVIASSVTLVLLVLYLTKEFWLSIEWWVYLFVAGVILVLLAVKKEKDA